MPGTDKPDLGQPSSYLALEPGAPVYSRDGEELGKVAEVRRAPEQDIFDGFVLNPGLTEGARFVAGEQVEEIFERGVLLKLDRAASEALPEPGG